MPTEFTDASQFNKYIDLSENNELAESMFQPKSKFVVPDMHDQFFEKKSLQLGKKRMSNRKKTT